MNVSDCVYFGDISDLRRGDAIEEPMGGTIIYKRNTCRPFVPGVYNLHQFRENAVMFCHQTVDPEKVHEYLMRTDVGADFRVENYVNRYDWMDFRNFGNGTDEPEYGDDLKRYLDHCFITCDNEFYKKSVEIVEHQANMYEVFDKGTKNIVSFIADISRDGEWNYAVLLEDKDQNKMFAFIFQDLYTLRREFPPESNSIKFDGKVNMEDFYY